MSKNSRLTRRLFTSRVLGASLALPLIEACSPSSGDPKPSNQDPKVNITSPKDGDSFASGSSLSIRWTAENITSLRIDFSTNSGASWQVLSNSVVASTGRYDWVLPTTLSNNYQVRILNPATGAVLATSGTFKVVSQGTPAASFISPKASETIVAGQVFKVEWSSENVKNLDLLFASNATNFETIASNIPPNQTSLDWTVPTAASTNARLRLVDTATKTVLANSPNFTILDKIAQITRPFAGQIVAPGKTFDITWNSAGIANIKIEFSQDGGSSWVMIADSVAAVNGKYPWAVPASLEGNAFRIRLIDLLDSRVLSTSGAFSIKNAVPTASFTVQPAAAEVLAGGEKFELKWTAADVSTLKFQFSSNNGSSWIDVSTRPADEGVYTWSVANLNSTQCKLRILNAADNNQLAISNTFRIRESKEIDLTVHTELNTVGNLKVFNGFFGSTDVSVQRSGTSTFLLHRMICTHAACAVSWQVSNNRYNCPCHGSNFAKDGSVLNGPAGSPLNTYEYKYKSSENKVFVFGS